MAYGSSKMGITSQKGQPIHERKLRNTAPEDTRKTVARRDRHSEWRAALRPTGSATLLDEGPGR